MSWVVEVGGRFYQAFVFEVSARELEWSLNASGVLGVEVREET